MLAFVCDQCGAVDESATFSLDDLHAMDRAPLPYGWVYVAVWRDDGGRRPRTVVVCSTECARQNVGDAVIMGGTEESKP